MHNDEIQALKRTIEQLKVPFPFVAKTVNLTPLTAGLHCLIMVFSFRTK